MKAALELGRRLAALSSEERPPVDSPEDVANLLGIEMAALEQEQLRVLLLDTKHCILGTRTYDPGMWGSSTTSQRPSRHSVTKSWQVR